VKTVAPPPRPPPRYSPLLPLKRDYVTQRSNEGLDRYRHPMLGKKSLSQGDSIDQDEPPKPAQRPSHLYEEIKPKLIYVDVDLTHRREV